MRFTGSLFARARMLSTDGLVEEIARGLKGHEPHDELLPVNAWEAACRLNAKTHQHSALLIEAHASMLRSADADWPEPLDADAPGSPSQDEGCGNDEEEP